MHRNAKAMGTLGKLAIGLVLGAALAGCVDAQVEVALTGPETARVTMTQHMDADFYAMVKMGAEDSEDEEAGFCADGALTENADGSADCVLSEEGPFAGLQAADGEDALVFAAAGPGLVRVSLPTAQMRAEAGIEDEMDAETRQMMEAFFAGHAITVRFSGAAVTETNMALAPDGRSAERAIPFLDLINGTADLPEELFAVVRAP